MKSTTKTFKTTILTLVLFIGLFGCKQKFELYEEPPWLKEGGSSIETLEKKGNYTIFLALMEKSGYTVSITNQLNTLFVPDDDAFKAYFQQANIASVDEMSEAQAYQLFSLHVMRNPRTTFDLRYEYAWSELQGPTGEYASLYFRKPTKSKSLPYDETVKYFPNFKGQTLSIHDINGFKHVPMVTIDYLEDLFAATDGSDYEFVYPNSKWGGLMQWHNAMVIPPTPGATIDQLANRTANGFIYYIDQVVAPIPSAEEYLRSQPEYSVFYDLMQRYAVYTINMDPKTKIKYYKKSYKDIHNICEEKGPSFSNNGPWDAYGRDIYTIFAPKNEVLTPYLEKTLLKDYPSIDSVPDVTIAYILNSQISTQFEVVSKISKMYVNSFGEVSVIKKEELSDGFMCSNAAIYSIKRMLEPNIFTTVPGRLFFDTEYSTFLNTLRASNMLITLSDPSQPVTLFAPKNDAMLAYGIRFEKATNTVQTKYDDKWTNLNDKTSEFVVNFSQDHIFFGEPIADLSGEGFIEMKSGNFIYYNNNKIYGAENQAKGIAVTVENKVVNEKNGISYDISEPIKCYNKMGNYIYKNPDLSLFAHFLDTTGILIVNDEDIPTKLMIPNIKMLANEKYTTAFIPNNTAMLKAITDGIIDTTNLEELKSFLLYHFLKGNTIFDDGKAFPSDLFRTHSSEVSITGQTVFLPIKVNNSKNNLTITDNSGQVVALEHANANRLVHKGVVHIITSVLRYK